MKSTAVLVLAALATMAAAPQPQPVQQGRQTPNAARTVTTAAAPQSAQQGRQTPDAAQTLIAPYVQPGPVNPPPDRPYLFKLGSLPARLWTPVPPPYDSNANRTMASNPRWWQTSGF
jgi:hypothetical protein